MLSARQTSIGNGSNSGDVPSEAIACLHTVLDNAGRYYVPPDKAIDRHPQLGAGVCAQAGPAAGVRVSSGGTCRVDKPPRPPNFTADRTQH